MSLAVLIPYRPDTEHRARVQAYTRGRWEQRGVEVIYADDGLDGPLFSLSRAMNRARLRTDAEVLVAYNVDALPLPPDALAELETLLAGGVPWSTMFDGQVRFTEQQTERLLAGEQVGPPEGQTDEGREALLAVRADVWDDLRGMDERFVGWGPEDRAWHQILSTVYPDGNDFPRYGRSWSLWHPTTSRAGLAPTLQLWNSYPTGVSAEAMRAWYLSR